MKYDSATPYVAVFALFRKHGKIAFVMRQNTQWMNGFYGLIAGKVEVGETATQAVIREAKEEAGIDLKPENLKPVLTVYRRAESDWVDILFEVLSWEGELTNAEPDKHSSLDWLEEDNLPDNIIPVSKFYLEQIKAGNSFGEYGWEE